MFYSLILSINLISRTSTALKYVIAFSNILTAILYIITIVFTLKLYSISIPYQKVSWAKFSSKTIYLRELVKFVLIVT